MMVGCDMVQGDHQETIHKGKHHELGHPTLALRRLPRRIKQCRCRGDIISEPISAVGTIPTLIINLRKCYSHSAYKGENIPATTREQHYSISR